MANPITLVIPDESGGPREQSCDTLAEALAASRLLAPTSPRHLLLGDGTWYLDQPLELDARDSLLRLEAAPGAHPVLVGGQLLAGWQPDGDRFWAAPLSGIQAGTRDFRLLEVNGRSCPRARFPAEGFLHHQSQWPVRWMSTTGGGWERQPTPDELSSMVYSPGDLGDWLDLRNAELTVYHMWDESVVGVASLDPARRLVRFANPAGHPAGAFGVSRYVVNNIREGMTQPGQWYLDRTRGLVVYWPLPGEDMANTVAIAPAVESIVRVRGTAEAPVHGLVLAGLSLRVTSTPLIAGGFGAGRFPGAVDLEFAPGATLRRLSIANVAGQGIREQDGDEVTVSGCHVHHTGACGIRVSQGRKRIDNNLIHDVGVIYPSAIGLWCSGRRDGGTGSLIAHNEIHDTPYTGLACSGDRHRLERNLIYRTMRQLHDGAGIYITFCKGVVVRGNWVRDIADTGGYGASGIYLDEQAEDCLVEGNLVTGVAWPSHHHMACRNLLRGNVFVSAGQAVMRFPRCANYALRENLVVAGAEIELIGPEAISVSECNLFHSRPGQVRGRSLTDYRPGDPSPLADSLAIVTTDPGLDDYARGHVRFAPGSVAAALGLAELDVRDAGLRPDFHPPAT